MRLHYRGLRYRDTADSALVQIVERGEIHGYDFDQAQAFYREFEAIAEDSDRKYLAAVDRFYLLTAVLGRSDVLHPWLYDRCREVEISPDRHLDLWAREHYKSTIITFAGIIQEIITDPEITIGIFAHTRDVSKKFSSQIKRECETNEDLRQLYPDIFWLKPESEAPSWSEVEFTVRRKGNPKEATVEAHGLVKGQPTSRHFMLRVYDDVVTLESVSTAEQVEKTTVAWEMSDNLGAGDGRFWMIGTRYSFGDTYAAVLDRKVVTPRIYPATHNGKIDGTPVFLSERVWAEKRKTQRKTIFAQMLQNPLSGKEQTFRPEWFKPWFVRPARLNVYIMGDPSRGKRAKSDRTAIAIIGIDAGGNKYLLGGANRRMTLSQRWDHLKQYHQTWSTMPGVAMVKVGYERYGQQSDDEYFQEQMQRDNYSFGIDELSWPLEGEGSKKARVERLQPDIQFSSFYFPGLVHVPGQGVCTWNANIDEGRMEFEPMEGELGVIKAVNARRQEYLACKPLLRKNEDEGLYDLTMTLMEQLIYFPFGTYDDLADATSRIYDMNPIAAMLDDRVPVEAATPD
jgi:hypothetical protein